MKNKKDKMQIAIIILLFIWGLIVQLANEFHWNCPECPDAPNCVIWFEDVHLNGTCDTLIMPFTDLVSKTRDSLAYYIGDFDWNKARLYNYDGNVRGVTEP